MKKAILYTPTSDQLEIHRSTAQFRILPAGRRWGKNYLALNDMMFKVGQYKTTKDNLDKGYDHCIVYWCSPVYRQAKRDYRRFTTWFKALISNKWDSELRVKLFNDAIIQFHGLEAAENIEGEGLDFLYIDEAGSVKNEAFYNSLLPMLADKSGYLLAFGKPKGKNNWYYDYFKRGKSQLESDNMYQSWQYKSSDNPYIDKKFLDEIKKQTPERIYKQEYNAEFIDDSAGVFSGYENCTNGDIWINKPEKGIKYRIGVDLGKVNDWTVCTVFDIKDNIIVNYLRFQDDWALQKKKIYSYAATWNNAEIVIDSTGVGDPVYEDLKNAGCHIIPFRFTESSRRNLIENLIIKIQNKNISYPLIPELLTELENYTFKKMPSGNIRYDHPSGGHDDCIMSLALAIWDDGEVRLDTLEGLGRSEEMLKYKFDNWM